MTKCIYCGIETMGFGYCSKAKDSKHETVSEQPVGLSEAHALDIINKHLLNTSVTKSDRWNKVARDIVCDLVEAGCPLTISVDLPVYEAPKRESGDEVNILKQALNFYASGCHFTVEDTHPGAPYNFAVFDKGEVARKALSQIEGGKP